jgi:hypothetical protein
MAVKDAKTISSYARQHAEMVAMLENLAEFVASMPAPEDDGNSIENIDYGYTGSVDHIHSLLTQASETVDEMSGR